MLTLGQLRTIIEQIGNGHDNKPIAVLTGPKVVNLDATCVIVQGDRILFEKVKG